MSQPIAEWLSAYAELKRWLARRLGNPHDAADVAQSSFEQVYAYAAATPVMSPRALLFRTARSLCIDRGRRRQLEARVLEVFRAAPPASAPSAERIAEQRQALDRIAARLARLPRKRREAFVLVRVYGYSHADAASRLCVSVAAIEKHVVRATLDCSGLFLELAELIMTRALEHALTLIARLHGGDPALAARTQAELTAWRGASEANETAYRDAHARWQAVGGASAGLRGTLAEPPRAASRAKRLAKAGAALGMALIAFAGLRWHLAQPLFEQALSTGPAQLVRTQLADGSSLELAARTRLHVALYRDRRSVRLESGEARFDVAADAARPFVIQTRAGEVRVIGTAFTVRDRGAEVSVSVERGRVAFAAAELTAGERVAVLDGRSGPVERMSADRLAPWRAGWIVFDDVPLSAALAEINAWRREPLRLADARAGEQRLTGSFRADDPEGFLGLLPRILPVEIRRGPQGPEIGSRP